MKCDGRDNTELTSLQLTFYTACCAVNKDNVTAYAICTLKLLLIL